METRTEVHNDAPTEHHPLCTFHLARQFVTKGPIWLQSLLLLAMRLYWGWQFFQTGKGKLMNHEKFVGFFHELQIPFPGFNAYLVGCTECIGGLLLLAGLCSRLVSLPLIFLLTIAYVTAEADSLKHIFSDPDKFVTAAPFLFLVTCLMVLAFGPGKISLDALIGRKLLDRKNSAGN